MSASGVHVSRSHLTTLVHRSLELLEPIYYAILSSITTSELVAMDETPVKVTRKNKGKVKTAYFWSVFAKNEVAFVYSSSRGKQVIADVLGKGCQRLLSDGYKAYESYVAARDDIIHAQCWSHVRRKFFEAREHHPQECDEILEYIRALFAIEQEYKRADDEQKLIARRLESRLLIEQLFSYLDTLWFERQVLKCSALGEAIAYTKKREQQLRAFLLYPDIPFSNNHVERSIRPIALGRKNWLFCWSEVGAKYAAIAYTLIECCKLHGTNPWEYLVDVLQRIDTHPARKVHLLTPKFWALKNDE